MTRTASLTLVVMSFFVLNTAQAAPHRNSKHHHSRFVPAANGNIVGGRPSGCPHAFCGCDASLFLFGRIIPELNLSTNWRRKYERAAPAPMTVAVRPGHVFVLLRQIAGDIWLVHDGNSGGGKTRVHPRSIAGYTIVDPQSRRMASL